MPERESDEELKKRCELESTLKSVDTAEAIVLKEAKRRGVEDDDQHQIGMAVRECMVNAVVHGNRYSSHKKVHLEVHSTRDRITITIGDEGLGFEPEIAARSASIREPRSAIRVVALLLIRAFMDDFDLHPRPAGALKFVL